MNQSYEPYQAPVPPEGFDPVDIQQNKGISAVAYLWVLFFLPLVVAPHSKFGKFHANQGLLLLITSAAGSIALRIVTTILSMILPLFGSLFSVFSGLFGLLMLGLCIYGFVNALNGKALPLPIIGQFTLLK